MNTNDFHSRPPPGYDSFWRKIQETEPELLALLSFPSQSIQDMEEMAKLLPTGYDILETPASKSLFAETGIDRVLLFPTSVLEEVLEGLP